MKCMLVRKNIFCAFFLFAWTCLCVCVFVCACVFVIDHQGEGKSVDQMKQED